MPHLAETSSVVDHLAVLADATRLRLLRVLEADELTVADLRDVLQLPQSTVSRHLKTLLDGGWVVHRREGTAGFYRLILDELDESRRTLWLATRESSGHWATAEQDLLRLRQHLANRDAGGFFAGVAGDWQAIRDEQYGRSFEAMAGLALLPADAVVADLGCGGGHFTEQLSAFAAEVVGIDASPDMLKAARRRLRPLDNVKLKQAELSGVPLDDASCDAVFCVLALSYVESPAAVASEMRRLLKPNGRCVIVDLLAHDLDDFRRRMGQRHRGFTADTVADLLASFTNTRVVPLPPEPDAKGPALFIASGGAGG
ncbi:MAG: metalloregulator ArsR/SmtB family transcription factor [Planctomycetota bacterium]